MNPVHLEEIKIALKDVRLTGRSKYLSLFDKALLLSNIQLLILTIFNLFN